VLGAGLLAVGVAVLAGLEKRVEAAVLGLWKDSPITLAKIAAFLSGFFPDPRTSLELYLPLAGFLLLN